jgi:hypothetical protein
MRCQELLLNAGKKPLPIQFEFNLFTDVVEDESFSKRKKGV